MTPSGNTCLTCRVKHCSILKPCSLETLAAISRFKANYGFKKGDIIIKEGQISDGVYFIKRGVVKIEKNGPNGRNFIINICGAGNIIGHRGMQGNTIQKSTVVALSEVTCCFIPVNFFNEILKNASDLEKQITEDYLCQLEQLEKKSISLAYKSVKEKVAEVILVLATIYNYEPKKQSSSIDLSRQDLADLTGATKEQVSSVLKEFERNSIIRYSGKHFYSLDIGTLKTIAEA